MTRRIPFISAASTRGETERSIACQPVQAPARVLRLPDVIARTGLGTTKIYELVAGGDFPRRVRLTTRAVGWMESDITAWLSARAAQSEAIDDFV